MKTTNTGFKGVYQRKSGKFESTVRFPVNHNGISYRFQVGTFRTLKEAVEARKEFIKSLN